MSYACVIVYGHCACMCTFYSTRTCMFICMSAHRARCTGTCASTSSVRPMWISTCVRNTRQDPRHTRTHMRTHRHTHIRLSSSEGWPTIITTICVVTAVAACSLALPCLACSPPRGRPYSVAQTWPEHVRSMAAQRVASCPWLLLRVGFVTAQTMRTCNSNHPPARPLRHFAQVAQQLRRDRSSDGAGLRSASSGEAAGADATRLRFLRRVAGQEETQAQSRPRRNLNLTWERLASRLRTAQAEATQAAVAQASSRKRRRPTYNNENRRKAAEERARGRKKRKTHASNAAGAPIHRQRSAGRGHVQQSSPVAQ